MINAFRKYALVLVVFIHTNIYLTSYFIVDIPAVLSFVHGKALGFFHPASILAAISGYLLFKDFSAGSDNVKLYFRDKYMKRVRSIFLPYAFWLTFFFIVNNILIIISNRYNPDAIRSDSHHMNFLNYLLSYFYPEMAVAQHLWYLNNLLFAFIAAPFIAVINRHRFFFPALLLIITYYYYLTFNEPHVIKYRFIIFFLCGGYLGANKKYLHFIFRNGAIVTAATFLIFLANYGVYRLTGDITLLWVVNHIVVTALIFLVAFYLFSKFSNEENTLYNRSNHFFLYIIHPFILSVLCKIMQASGYFTHMNYWLMAAMAITLTFVIIRISHFLYELLHRFAPVVTKRFL